jgi:eukaryotic-like serine/threonine-protein kinase
VKIADKNISITQFKTMNQNSSTKIGRFEVSKRLGEGLQGKVYLGWDPDLERQVALKVITPVAGNATYSQDVIDEARIAAKITHPNVIPIYEVGMYQNLPLLVFEYVDGVTLKHYLKEHGHYNEKDALSIMVRVAVGIACAHEQGIVHLDLSPNNIMIDKEGRPHIMDFGLARVIASVDKIKSEKDVAGTPRYMSPEHINDNALCPASDVFSLGLVFYELLTGMPAIKHKDFDDIINAVEQADIHWGKLQHQGITPEIIATMRDMLQVDPASRYKSASELVPVLDEIIAIQRNEDSGSLSLDFLLRRLQRRPEFPACSHSIAEINRLTAEDSNTDFNQLGAVIVRDYSLTNRVMKIANSVIFDRGGDGVKTISQAVARLGLKLVRMICNGLLLLNQADNKDNDLKDILVASFVAGLIARHITASINRRIAEEAFICALFHNLGNHLLIFYLPDEYEDINTLISKGEEPLKAEREILSTTTASLGMAVAEKWNFPETIINCMTRLPPGLLEAPKSDEDILRHAANFANELCRLVMSNAEGLDLLLEVNPFIERHQTLFVFDATKLAQLTASAADKFSQLAPGLGINYNDSNFCNHLSNFSSAIEEALSQEEVELKENIA